MRLWQWLGSTQLNIVHFQLEKFVMKKVYSNCLGHYNNAIQYILHFYLQFDLVTGFPWPSNQLEDDSRDSHPW